MILPSGGVQRFKAWLADFETNGSLGGTLLFDVDQNSGTKGSTSGDDWPVNLRHGSIFAVKRVGDGKWDWRLGCPFECLAPMGFHMYPEMAGAWGVSPMREILGAFAANQIQGITGNGMHLAIQASWMLYVLSNIVVKDCDSQGNCGRRAFLAGSSSSWEHHLAGDDGMELVG